MRTPPLWGSGGYTGRAPDKGVVGLDGLPVEAAFLRRRNHHPDGRRDTLRPFASMSPDKGHRQHDHLVVGPAPMPADDSGRHHGGKGSVLARSTGRNSGILLLGQSTRVDFGPRIRLAYGMRRYFGTLKR